MSSPITTHVLDTSLGLPAGGIAVTLERESGEGLWSTIGEGTTDGDGRASNLLQGDAVAAGSYRLSFDVAAYFAGRGVTSLYRVIPIIFSLTVEEDHVHIPLLLAPHGYSTYRGS